ncbi:MAG: cupin domain-containing protein [Actinomycetota bacterium]
MSGFSRVSERDVELRERRGGGASSRDIAGALGAESMAVRRWVFGPGHEMAYHRHRTQEEVYHLVSGGPQELLVDGDVLVVEDGDWVRVPKETPRRIQNRSDRDAVWMIIAAPRGEGILDGVRLDPRTGEEIPR